MAWRPAQGAQQYPPRAPGGVTAQQAQASGGVNLQQYSQLLGALSGQAQSQYGAQQGSQQYGGQSAGYQGYGGQQAPSQSSYPANYSSAQSGSARPAAPSTQSASQQALLAQLSAQLSGSQSPQLAQLVQLLGSQSQQAAAQQPAQQQYYQAPAAAPVQSQASGFGTQLAVLQAQLAANPALAQQLRAIQQNPALLAQQPAMLQQLQALVQPAQAAQPQAQQASQQQQQYRNAPPSNFSSYESRSGPATSGFSGGPPQRDTGFSRSVGNYPPRRDEPPRGGQRDDYAPPRRDEGGFRRDEGGFGGRRDEFPPRRDDYPPLPRRAEDRPTGFGGPPPRHDAGPLPRRDDFSAPRHDFSGPPSRQFGEPLRRDDSPPPMSGGARRGGFSRAPPLPRVATRRSPLRRSPSPSRRREFPRRDRDEEERARSKSPQKRPAAAGGPVRDRLFKGFSFAVTERDVLSLRQRYPRLHIARDFSQALSHISEVYPIGLAKMPLHYVTRMTIDHDQPLPVQASAMLDQESGPGAIDPVSGMRFYARVMLLSGAPTSCKAKDLVLQLKFIVGKREKSELMCLGGAWQPQDGADPQSNNNALINTAIRTVKEQTDVDLSQCTQWARFLELQYVRSEPDSEVREVSVIFVPDIWNALPKYEDFAATYRARLAAKRREDGLRAQKEAQRKQEEEKAVKEVVDPNALEIDDGEPPAAPDPAAKAAAAEKAKADAEAAEKAKEEARKKQEEEDEKSIPKEVSLMIAPRHSRDPKTKNMIISLDGLLDYDESDKYEATFEVSLFAEIFHEMLQRDFGYYLLQGLTYMPEPSADKKEEKKEAGGEVAASLGKRAREDGESGEVETKKAQRADSEKQASPVAPAAPSDTSAAMEGVKKEGDQAPTSSEASESVGGSQQQAQPSSPPSAASSSAQANPELLFAFQYFDRLETGSIRTEDLETVFLCLGVNMTLRTVHAIAAKFAENGRINYRKLLQLK